MSTAKEAALNFEAHLLALHDFRGRVDAMLADVATYGTHLVIGREGGYTYVYGMRPSCSYRGSLEQSKGW